MSKQTGVYTCELCDKQFNTRQAKSMHKQRLHPSGTIDNSDIEKRIAVLEKRIHEIQTEVDGLRAKHAFNLNNTFGPCTNSISIMATEQNLTINNQSSTQSIQNSNKKQISVEDIHPFGKETEEFISASQFKDCGYNLVKLLQLSHFNPAHPEHMNFIMIPNTSEEAYVLNSEYRWVKADLHTTLISVLWRLVHRLKMVNPTEALKYDDVVKFYTGGMEAITLKAMQGIVVYSRLCVKILSDMGIALPGDLM